MLLNEVHNDSDFVDSKIPDGSILVFYSLNENGEIVKRYKDSSGNFGEFGVFKEKNSSQNLSEK